MYWRRTLTGAALLLLCACSGPTSLEDLNIAYAVAFDADPSGRKLQASYLFPFYQKDSIENIVTTASGESSKETQAMAESQISGKLAEDKVKVILIERKLASSGLDALLQPYVRDRNMPALLKIAITEQPAESFLRISAKRFDPATRLTGMIRENERNNALPNTSLFQFVNRWINYGEDPVLPMLSMQRDQPAVSGIALFRDDKYVSALRGYDDIVLFAMLQRSVSHAKYNFDWRGKRATLWIKRSSVRYRWQPDASPPRMEIVAQVKASLSDSVPLSFGVPTHAEFAEIESTAGDHMREHIERLLRSFQQLRIDPAGLGAIARSKQRNWEPKAWTDTYPKVQCRVDVRVRFVEDEI